jgi:hypothetical protein
VKIIPLMAFDKGICSYAGKNNGRNMNFKNTNADPETSTLTHQGHSTSRLSMESLFRPIDPLHPLLMPDSVGHNSFQTL